MGKIMKGVGESVSVELLLAAVGGIVLLLEALVGVGLVCADDEFGVSVRARGGLCVLPMRRLTA